jgi:predicted amidohydrolase
VLSQAQDSPIAIMADIDLKQIEQARAQIPSLENRRPTAYKW